jgi:hypothetical protein
VTNEHRPFYAGWTTSNTTPQSAVGIHHPQGDVKKISVENHPLGTGTFTDSKSNLYCDRDAHWIVRRWDEGVTEGGSSGSPIFDEQHRLVGLLSGGDANCANPVNDYYSKFSLQWDKYASDTESLRSWLSPDNKNITSLGGYDPVSPYGNRCDTLGNIGRNEARILIPSDGWGYLTGKNDRNRVSFAEKFTNDTVAIIIGMEAHVAKVADEGSRVRFSVWSGEDFPIQTLYSKEVFVTSDYHNYPLHIYFDRTMEIYGNYFIGYSLDDDYSEFAVYQSGKRPHSGISGMYVEDANGFWMALEDDVPPMYSSLGVRAIGEFRKKPSSHQPVSRNLKIVFQPGNPTLFAYFEDPTATVKLECYDTSGKRMLLNELSRHTVMLGENICLQVELNISHLPPGMYLLQAFDNQKKRAGKFIKVD